MTSQLPTKQWHEHLADPTIADAILDRILHNAHRLVLKGPTRRTQRPRRRRTPTDNPEDSQRRFAPIMMRRSRRSRWTDLGDHDGRNTHFVLPALTTTNRFSLRGLAALPGWGTRTPGGSSRHAVRPPVIRGVSRTPPGRSRTSVRCLVFMVMFPFGRCSRQSPRKCDQLFSDAVTLSDPCATLLGNPTGTGTGFLLAASFLGRTPELSRRGPKKGPTFVSAPDLFSAPHQGSRPTAKFLTSTEELSDRHR